METVDVYRFSSELRRGLDLPRFERHESPGWSSLKRGDHDEIPSSCIRFEGSGSVDHVEVNDVVAFCWGKGVALTPKWNGIDGDIRSSKGLCRAYR